MLRLILAVLAGFVVTAALSTAVDQVLHATGVYPPPGQPMFDTGLLLIATAYRIVFQILGAYVVAMIAKEKAKAAVWTIGILGAILWLAGGLANQDLGPIWYSVLGAALSIPTVLIGLKLYVSRMGKTVVSNQ